MRTSTVAVTALAVLGLALAGCGDDDETPPESTPGATNATASPGGSGVAECLVGEWRSTGVGERVGGDGADLQLGGGAGVALSTGEDGGTTLDFSGMEPVDFTGTAVGVDLAGSLTYTGPASATLQTASDAESGTWEPADPDWSGVKVTVDVTQPVEGTPLDEAPLGEGIEDAEEWTGDVVDVDPVLGEGSYQCQDDGTVLLTSADDVGMTWTFAPA